MITYKRLFEKDNKRFILFKYNKEKEYNINETGQEQILKFSSLKKANDYLRVKEVLK
jgi:hypothetical protein